MVISAVYCLTILCSLKSTRSSLLAFLSPFAARVFSLSCLLALLLIRRGSLFDLTESCCSDSPAPRHQAYTHYRDEAPSFFFSTLLQKKKKKGESQALPPLPVRNQTHSPSCTRDNKIIHEFKMDAVEAVPRPAVLCAYGPCRM